eukprot:2891214-Rhodomonas_salina.1
MEVTSPLLKKCPHADTSKCTVLLCTPRNPVPIDIRSGYVSVPSLAILPSARDRLEPRGHGSVLGTPLPLRGSPRPRSSQGPPESRSTGTGEPKTLPDPPGRRPQAASRARAPEGRAGAAKNNKKNN